jgi:hypothetical protein
MRTAALIRFNEARTYDFPVDVTGSLAPLAPPAGLTAPESDDGIVGRARVWGASSGYHAAEAIAGATRLLRDVTVEAIALLPWQSTNGTYRLVTRGKGTSDAERELYGLQVVVTGAPGAPVVKLQMRWQVVGGASATVPGVTFEPPAGWLYLAAVRRWVSAASVAVDYYVNGELAGTVTSTGGNIGDGDGGTMMIGCDATPTGMPEGSALDDIRITRDARTAEEIRQTYRRMFTFGLYGYDLLLSLQPPGEAWTRDPESRIQRFFAIAGDGLGIAWAKAAELLDDFLPDRAWSLLDRWETIMRLVPRAADSLAIRRARILAFIRKVHGYSRALMLDNVAELLDVDISDLSFVENSTVTLDEFDGALLKPLWTSDNNPIAVSPPFVTGGKLYLTNDVGADTRWNGSVRGAAVLRTSIPAPGGVEVIGAIDYFNATGTPGAAAGIFLLNTITGDALLFGVKNVAGVAKWYAGTIIAGAYYETLGDTPPGDLTPGANAWTLRIHDKRDGTVDCDVQIDTVDFLGSWTNIFSGLQPVAGAAWAGFFISDTTNPTTGGAQIHATDFRIFAPDSLVAFEWAIYRDPALGGSPDFVGARQVVERTKPAHTRGAIVQSLVCHYDTDPDYWDQSLLGG